MDGGGRPEWLRAHGWGHVERVPTGTGYRGDVLGIPGLVIEAKDHARHELAAWTTQAARDAAGRPWVVVVKRRGTSDVGDSYAVTSLTHLTELLHAAGYAHTERTA